MKRFLHSDPAGNVFLLAVQLPVSIKSTPTVVVEQRPWWETAIFYEIFVRSFYDSNGDGIGDFNGITEKLDYLADLGINAIWLMPIHPSPTYHGYDVINYFNVNPDYGTFADFIRLAWMKPTNTDIHIIIDLVINHSPPVKIRGLLNANSSPTHLTATGIFGRILIQVIAEAPSGNPWHPGYTVTTTVIFGSDSMPDLNYTNPDVGAEMLKVVKFWLVLRS